MPSSADSIGAPIQALPDQLARLFTQDKLQTASKEDSRGSAGEQKREQARTINGRSGGHEQPAGAPKAVSGAAVADQGWKEPADNARNEQSKNKAAKPQRGKTPICDVALMWETAPSRSRL